MEPSDVIPVFSARSANKGLDLTGILDRVVRRQWYVLGDEVKAFEREFAAYVGTAHCVGVANGTDALELALRAAGVGSGDRVATVANAGYYSSAAIRAVGAVPVYVDVDARTLTMCPEGLQVTIGNGVSAVIATHLYGQLADIERISENVRKASIPLIEDCAQAHGARRSGRRAGAFGDIGCFSFYPTKNLGALGDAGAIVCNDDRCAERLRELRQYGWSRKYHVSIPGGRNSRLDELQAAVLREKLPLLDKWNDERRSIAARYSHAFTDLPVTVPASVADDYVGHLYVLRVEHRDDLATFLRQRGVATEIHYPVPDHQQCASREPCEATLPVTEFACDSVISLPCFPGLDDWQVQSVIGAVIEFHRSGGRSCSA